MIDDEEDRAHEEMNGHEIMRDEELARRLVIRRGIGGRGIYDDGAKRDLIERCLSGGESVARMARAYGVNANQLHNWIALYRKQTGQLLPLATREMVRESGPAFIPVVTVKSNETPEPAEIKLDITLTNGVRAELGRLNLKEVLAILPVLSGLPCSASTPD